ncbi:hypothetical protein HK099_006416 [Clydaea vesicula]|uniref:Uncharacterized protein n=1 Tax=Clydaea vesicula TaxID=447962 RepID=A0AAD5XX00_9FUNG|nr:hypothetical protein HK099_006416 [Clydaea vesicula]
MKFVLFFTLLAMISTRSDKICQPTACHGVNTRCSRVSRPRPNDYTSLCTLQESTGECGWTVNSTFEDCLIAAGASEILNNTDVVFINTTKATAGNDPTSSGPDGAAGNGSVQAKSSGLKISGFFFIGLLSTILINL